MEAEKKYLAKWWFWFLLLLIITGIVLASLSYVGIIGKTIVERKVFEHSYQKHEADKTASTVYAAQLAQLQRKLSDPNIDESAKIEIQAQIDAIIVLQRTKED